MGSVQLKRGVRSVGRCGIEGGRVLGGSWEATASEGIIRFDSLRRAPGQAGDRHIIATSFADRPSGGVCSWSLVVGQVSFIWNRLLCRARQSWSVFRLRVRFRPQKHEHPETSGPWRPWSSVARSAVSRHGGRPGFRPKTRLEIPIHKLLV